MSSFPNLPAGKETVDVSIICNAMLDGIPMSRFTTPNIRGLEKLQRVPSFSFFIQHASGRRILFDMGVRKDWSNLSPGLSRRMAEAGWTAQVFRDVPEILEDNGIPLQSIENVVWSHWHWDHVGDMSKMPPDTGLVVGPGFKSSMTPGYPTDGTSPILETDYVGRHVSEITDFELTVAAMPAHDYFGDGSLYLLSTPGHAVGHLSALARTTSHDEVEGVEDTFILIGGDCCHHMGQLRPSGQCLLPHDVWFSISQETAYPPRHSDQLWTSQCFYNGADIPFMSISDHGGGASAASNPTNAINSLQNLQNLDAISGRVFIVIAHDKSLLDVVDLFPSLANDWKQKGWADRTRWLFLNDIAE